MIQHRNLFRNLTIGNKRPVNRVFSGGFYLLLIIILSTGSWGCSRKIPCPKMPKQKKDTAFRPAAVSDDDDGTNNPNDNAATMTFGGGGFKRDKNGLVKKKKFKNLLSKQARERKKYTKIKEPGGRGSAYPSHKYTDIKEPSGRGSAYPSVKYTDIKEPSGSGTGGPQKYTKLKGLSDKKKKRKYRKNVQQPASSTPGFND